MKILLTGHRGFIGSALYGKLRDARLEVFGYDLKNGDDIRDRLKLEYLFETERFNKVIHLAALTGVRRGELYPEEYIATNVMGTKNLIELSQKYGVHHFINFSSSSVYGQDTKNALTEDVACKPQSIYGMTKLMAELLVQRSDMLTTTIRPFTVYGDYGRPDQVIMKWINFAKEGKPVPFYGDGKSARGYTHVDDLLDGVIKCLDRNFNNKHETYNLGGDTLVTLNNLFEIFKKVKKDIQANMLDRPAGDNLFSFANTLKAQKDLAWKPGHKFNSTVTRIIKHELS
jgi:UDP-glucuronate 4-epimerase